MTPPPLRRTSATIANEARSTSNIIITIIIPEPVKWPIYSTGGAKTVSLRSTGRGRMVVREIQDRRRLVVTGTICVCSSQARRSMAEPMPRPAMLISTAKWISTRGIYPRITRKASSVHASMSTVPTSVSWSSTKFFERKSWRQTAANRGVRLHSDSDAFVWQTNTSLGAGKNCASCAGQTGRQTGCDGRR